MIYIGNNRVNLKSLTVPLKEKDVNFYDWEGTLLYSYTKQEALALTTLPALPDRTAENLTNEGWNMTIADIASWINAGYPYVSVGCTYHTTDGKTYLYANPTDLLPTIYIYISASIANDSVIDWGDGSTTNVITSAAKHSHTYTAPYLNTNVTITVTSSTGTHTFISYIFGGTYADNIKNRIISCKMSDKARLWADNSPTNCGFISASFLETIALSKYNYYGSGSYNSLFYGCNNLKHINIPNTFPPITDKLFQNCYLLKRASVPIEIGGNYACTSCYNLSAFSPKITSNTTDNCYYNVFLLKKCYIDRTSLGDRTFYANYSLKKVTISENVTSINYRAFQTCSFLEEIYIKATSVPTLSAAFTAPNAFYIIYVPRASYNDYITASNWADIASHIYPYDF